MNAKQTISCKNEIREPQAHAIQVLVSIIYLIVFEGFFKTFLKGELIIHIRFITVCVQSECKHLFTDIAYTFKQDFLYCFLHFIGLPIKSTFLLIKCYSLYGNAIGKAKIGYHFYYFIAYGCMTSRCLRLLLWKKTDVMGR